MNQVKDMQQMESSTEREQQRGGSAVLALFRGGGVNFILAVVVLLAAAVGLNAAIGALQLSFKKEPVPMAMKFGDAMPEVIGTWVRVARNDTLDSDTLDALGTSEFLFCNYLDARAMGRTVADVQLQFAAMKSFEEQQAEVSRLRKAHPDAVMTLGLTYYTGKADTVAHIPERCYVGNGYEPENPVTEQWDLGDKQVSVRHITFEDQTGRGVMPCNVAYFFQCNGKFVSDSMEVRSALQDLRARYGYYAKVELMTVTKDTKPESVEPSKKAMQQFLAVALPEISKSLPDWSRYEQKR